MWSSSDCFEVTVHQILAEFCPVENFGNSLGFQLTHLQFLSRAVNNTGVSICATSYYFPQAYDASTGRGLVNLDSCISKFSKIFNSPEPSSGPSIVSMWGSLRCQLFQTTCLKSLGLLKPNCMWSCGAPVAWWIRELTLNPLGFSPLWFEPRSGCMWESQVLLTDGQVVFLWVLRFSPTFDERSAPYK